jgi:acetyl esterase/lipase
MRLLFAVLLLASVSRAADPAVVLDLWPGKAPGETKDLPPEGLMPPQRGQMEVKRLANVSTPQLAVYRPAGTPNGTMVVVAPGGGYSILAIEHEGEEVAAWLNKVGVTVGVLKYRVPKRPGQSPDNLAQLQDAQRALGLARQKAADWGVNPDRVGALGFSAGGHLVASLCTHFDKRTYDAVDAADALSCRPAFAVLVYPAYLHDKDGNLKADLPVTKGTPPMFFAHASDDPVSSVGSVALYRALHAAGVPAELHLFASGGHGFGLRPGKGPASDWPARCEHWMQLHGWLKPD